MKQSAVHACHVEADAQFAEQAGWALPARFAGAERELAAAHSGVALADISNLAKVDISAAEPPQALGDCWTLGRRHYLLTGAPDRRAGLVAAAGDRGIDVTSVFAAFVLVGPRSRDVLAKLTSLNASARALPDRAAAQTSLAHVHATILRQDRSGLPAFVILAARDYAEHVWESILHAGEEYGIVPLGLEALERLGD